MKKIYTIILSLIISFIITSQTFACSCMMPESPEKSAERANSVFIWKVINIEKPWIIDDMISYWWELQVTFEVSSIIKWNLNKNITITTPNNWAACWYNFQDNKEYIVYTSWEKDKQKVYLCWRTSQLKNASEDLDTFKDNIDNEIEYTEKDITNDYKNIFLYLIIISVIIIMWIKRESKLKLKKETEKEEETNKK